MLVDWKCGKVQPLTLRYQHSFVIKLLAHLKARAWDAFVLKVIFPNQDIEYGQPSSLARRETKNLIHVSAAVSSVSRWELIKDFLSPLKWKLTWCMGYTWKGSATRLLRTCYACLNQAKTLCSACALYFCFLSDPGIALCFRFFGGNLPRQTTTRLRCLCAWT